MSNASAPERRLNRLAKRGRGAAGIARSGSVALAPLCAHPSMLPYVGSRAIALGARLHASEGATSFGSAGTSAHTAHLDRRASLSRATRGPRRPSLIRPPGEKSPLRSGPSLTRYGGHERHGRRHSECERTHGDRCRGIRGLGFTRRLRGAGAGRRCRAPRRATGRAPHRATADRERAARRAKAWTVHCGAACARSVATKPIPMMNELGIVTPCADSNVLSCLPSRCYEAVGLRRRFPQRAARAASGAPCGEGTTYRRAGKRTAQRH